ncbi:hypothetical protein DFR49_0790 [Hephaestia caeni]|uniref:Uncharacterized protein n=1 Tax=Hephaestia caeni TaxID=645617 RepID=A0A397P9I7_9SPHN|nr:hypothetical protein [Hephaestia caeni]RIA46256.1 hypothetical protein DFR49_0790 [Hephaestia caeni]
MTRSFRAFRLWCGPRLRRLGAQALVALGYTMSMWALIAIPITLFVILTQTTGANVDGALVLTPVGRWLLYVLAGATFLGSIAVGGIAKVILRSRHLAGPWLFLIGLGLLFGLADMFDKIRIVVSSLHAGPHDDNAQAAAFFTFWLLMVGYAAKAVWDEARDRFCAAVQARIPKIHDV